MLLNKLAAFFADQQPSVNSLTAPYLSKFNTDIKLPRFAPEVEMPPSYDPSRVMKVNDATRKKVVSEIRKTDWFREYRDEFGEEPNLGPDANYDYITAWLSGVRPKRSAQDDNRFHWDSMTRDGVMLKKPDHPTVWKTHFMEITGLDPDEIGLRNENDAQMYIKMFRR